MPIKKSRQQKPPRKRATQARAKPRRRAGSRVGDDLVKAFEEMAAHLRGEIELEVITLPARSPIAKQTTPSS